MGSNPSPRRVDLNPRAVQIWWFLKGRRASIRGRRQSVYHQGLNPSGQRADSDSANRQGSPAWNEWLPTNMAGSVPSGSEIDNSHIVSDSAEEAVCPPLRRLAGVVGQTSCLVHERRADMDSPDISKGSLGSSLSTTSGSTRVQQPSWADLGVEGVTLTWPQWQCESIRSR